MNETAEFWWTQGVTLLLIVAWFVILWAIHSLAHLDFTALMCWLVFAKVLRLEAIELVSWK